MIAIGSNVVRRAIAEKSIRVYEQLQLRFFLQYNIIYMCKVSGVCRLQSGVCCSSVVLSTACWSGITHAGHFTRAVCLDSRPGVTKAAQAADVRNTYSNNNVYCHT